MPSFSPGFYFVSTPIGNLGDLTPRALEVLKQAQVVLCEDTRVTLDLYRAFDLKAPKLIRYDQHTNEKQCEEWTREYVENPGILAVVSDAGTPGVSDPGASIAAAVSSGGLPIFTVPGVSSTTALLSIAGFLATEFAFMGFFQREKKEILKKCEALESSAEIKTWIFFESPHRIVDTLKLLNEGLKSESEWVIAVGKELTKLHEKFWRGELAHVSKKIEDEVGSVGPKGEWVVALHRGRDPIMKTASDSNWINALDCLLHANVSTKEASVIVSRQFHVPKNLVYEKALSKKSEK